MEKIIYPIRINRYLALNNHCSRREADKLIEKKIVKINGKIAVLGDKVGENDIVEVDKKAKHTLKENVYFAFYKPVGMVTHSPEAGEKSIASVQGLPGDVFPIGRLDKASHGLIILTNDGRVTDKLLNPEYDHEKVYEVAVDKKISNFFVRHLEEGIQLEDFKTKPAKVEKLSDNKFKIILSEGKKHQIRRMCAAFDYAVRDLKRVRIMNVKIEELRPGQKRKLVGEELDKFLRDLQIQ